MKSVYGAYSASKLEIKGIFHCQGSQPVGTAGGCPQWVADVFEANPDIDYIATGNDERGAFYRRMA